MTLFSIHTSRTYGSDLCVLRNFDPTRSNHTPKSELAGSLLTNGLINKGTTLLGVVVKIANAKAMKLGVKTLAADA
jgi:hypothetical protein